MKKALPFIFPVAALLLVIFLAFRWYGDRTERTTNAPEFGEGVPIEELSEMERDQVLRGEGSGDYKTVDLVGADDLMGTIRYEIVDGKVRFSIAATLPEIESGQYQVWLKDVNSEAIRKAITLEYSKGGYFGSVAISESTLPFEVLVTREMMDDNNPEDILLRGIIEK